MQEYTGLNISVTREYRLEQWHFWEKTLLLGGFGSHICKYVMLSNIGGNKIKNKISKYLKIVFIIFHFKTDAKSLIINFIFKGFQRVRIQ